MQTLFLHLNSLFLQTALANEAMDKRKSWTTYDEDSGFDGDVLIQQV